MSYALGQTADEIRVGAKAASDPILARASLEAAEILAAASKRPRSARPAFIQREIGRRYGSRARRDYLAALRARPKQDQALYDSMRIAIADHYARIGLRYLQKAVKGRLGERFVPAALGTTSSQPDEGRAIGCAIGGGATGLLAIIGAAYTGGAAAAPIGAAGTLAMTAAGCGADQQAAQGELAAAQTAAAQATLEAARVQAEAEDRRAAASQKTMITVAAIGGGVLLLLGVGYMIVKD